MRASLIASRYRLDELLGRSAMSEVWRATDRELARRVAIKLLLPQAENARFDREARAVASLAHPNIVQLYDYGEDRGRPYMVFEYLAGGTLEDRLAGRRPLPDDEARRLAAEIAAGLAHAHSRGITHRDLKPANVLFDEEDRAKLADFGIARLSTAEGFVTAAGTIVGTPSYMSPEQAAGGTGTAASDVYSFGVILYQMLTGRLPFEATDLLQLAKLHQTAAPPPLSRFRDDAPADLAGVIDAALRKDPNARPRDGSALLAALGLAASAADHPTVPARSSGDTTAMRPPPGSRHSRRRVPLAVVGLFVLATAGAAVAYELTQGAPPARTKSPRPDTNKAQTLHQASTAGEATIVSTTNNATTTPGTTTQAPAGEITTRRATTQRTTPPATTAPPAATTEPSATTAPITTPETETTATATDTTATHTTATATTATATTATTTPATTTTAATTTGP